MSRRRPSLMDILEEDQVSPSPTSSEPPVAAAAPAPTPVAVAPVEPPKSKKSDYIRLSITVPPDMFERLQAISLKRRREKQPYTFCHLARQAMLEWLYQQDKDSQ